MTRTQKALVTVLAISFLGLVHWAGVWIGKIIG